VQLSRHTVIAGHPAVAIRALLRQWHEDAGAGLVEEHLGVTESAAKEVLETLVAEGFLKARRTRRDGVRFDRTVKGSALAMASAAKPLQRSTVEARLKELIDRMVHVNASDEFLCGVQEAFVFGSYLGNNERLGDLDINLKLYRKDTDGERFVDAALRSANASGRHFSNYLERLFWPETKVLLFLKHRSRVYSLHREDPLLERDPSIPRRAIFRDRQPVTMPTAPAPVMLGTERRSRRPPRTAPT
jgi:DNA-binding MarR family transcriptional regulator